MDEVNGELVNSLAKAVYGMACYNGDKEDAKDIAEFMAYEVIDLIEIKSPNAEVAKSVASEVITNYQLSKEATDIVRKYFNLSSLLLA